MAISARGLVAGATQAAQRCGFRAALCCSCSSGEGSAILALFSASNLSWAIFTAIEYYPRRSPPFELLRLWLLLPTELLLELWLLLPPELPLKLWPPPRKLPRE